MTHLRRQIEGKPRTEGIGCQIAITMFGIEEEVTPLQNEVK